MAGNTERAYLMPPAPHVNSLPGCQKPDACRARIGFLCGICASAVSAAKFEQGAAAILRIELSASHRRRLGDMARERGTSADVLASRMLTALIDDDAAAHGEAVTG